MNKLFILLALVWQNRFTLLLPAILGPLAMVLWSIGQPQWHAASATLQLDDTKARSPLLQNIAHPGHAQILWQILTNPSLLDETQTDTGLTLNHSQFDLQVLNNQLLRIRLQHPQAEGLDQVLTTHINHFTDELLAPERFRAEQQLAQLESQAKAYKEQLQNAKATFTQMMKAPIPSQASQKETHMRKLIAQEFNVQRLEAQVKLAGEAYADLLADSKAVTARFDETLTQGIAWFAEPVHLEPNLNPIQRHMAAVWQGLLAGLAIGLAMIVLSTLLDKSITRDDDIMGTLGLKILGRIPHLGALRFTKGGATIQQDIS